MTCNYQICNCNRTMPLNSVSGERLGAQLGVDALPVATQLCGRDAEHFLEAARGSDTVVVGCTQEAPLFRELAREQRGVAPLRFVNLRETAGWSSEAYRALPKMAALLADAALPAPEPVAAVRYTSQGRLLIIGAPDTALAWADQMRDALNVTVLLVGKTDGGASLPEDRTYNVYTGADVSVTGWLGAFTVNWRQHNPIDLDLCVRCNACVAACPEGAIDLHYQIDQDACARHGDCVRACSAATAIDFARRDTARSGTFDLVLDLCEQPLIALHQPPQGYIAPGPDLREQSRAALELTQMTGEFKKPKFFQYKQQLCAHERNSKVGCNACVEICSAQAITGNGDGIRVEPQLCMGCGACTTVCPSGALQYAYPDAPHLGRRIKTLLSTYRGAGGERPTLLFHAEEGANLIAQMGRLASAGKGGKGMPAHVIPLAVHHIASAGLDIWLAALSYGASGIAIVATGREAPAYRAALRAQMDVAQAILSGLGYEGVHLTLLEAANAQQLDAALRALPDGKVPVTPARFNVAASKREALDFSLHHLHEHAPLRPQHVALPPGAPFGTLVVNTNACTLCMACTGACPSSALMSAPDLPRLRFVEKNCVQCGLCAQTCPESAITLEPRLAFTPEATTPVVLNEAQPFHCIRCDKPIGSIRVIEAMLDRLSGHAAFTGNLDRLRMCGDCRVVDMMKGTEHSQMQRTEQARGTLI